MHIPSRFIEAVDKHLLGNMLNLPDYPLMLIISGDPGTGKTYQLRKYLEAVDINVCTMSASDMESYRAGQPVNILCNAYIEASDKIKAGFPTALVIDDIDLVLGEWEQNTGTVNHQTLLAFFMHIADNPECVEYNGERIAVARVPIFFTGNYIEKMYEPLVRNGRANRFEWKPTREEKIKMLKNIDVLSNGDIAEILVDKYPEKEIVFFSSVIANLKANYLSDIALSVVYKHILTMPVYKENLLRKYYSRIQEIKNSDILSKASEMFEAEIRNQTTE